LGNAAARLEAQADALRLLGVHHGQGWLHGRPTSRADLPALLAGHDLRR